MTDYPNLTHEIPFRDLCILPDEKTKTYYMIGFAKHLAFKVQRTACYYGAVYTLSI